MIWRFDHLDTLSRDEFEFWMRNPLPLGWAILSAPTMTDPRTAEREQKWH